MNNKSLTLKSIAGYCIEEALWKLVVDIVQEIQENGFRMGGIDPDMVIIENEDFHVVYKGKVLPSFCAPEEETGEAAMVWSIGALLCYASSGHPIFGGSGSLYQKKHPSVKLPVLQKKHSALTPLVQHCLAYSPQDRINLNDMVIEAKNGLELCKKKARSKSEANVGQKRPVTSHIDERWPEEMIEVNFKI